MQHVNLFRPVLSIIELPPLTCFSAEWWISFKDYCLRVWHFVGSSKLLCIQIELPRGVLPGPSWKWRDGLDWFYEKDFRWWKGSLAELPSDSVGHGSCLLASYSADNTEWTPIFQGSYSDCQIVWPCLARKWKTKASIENAVYRNIISCFLPFIPHLP